LKELKNIPRPKSCKILLIGDGCLDIYHYGTCDRLSPEAPVPVFKKTNEIHRPGMAYNVEQNLKSFGLYVTLITNDEKITKERFLESKYNTHLLRVDNGETKMVKETTIESFEGYDAIALADYDKGLLRKSSIEKIVDYCKMNSIPLFVDSKKKDLSLFEGAILKVNQQEAKSAVKLPDKSELIITLGSYGARWRGKRYTTTSIESYDVCGAGDTFFAALIYQYMETNDIERSIIFANKCARITVSKIGTHSLTEQELSKVKENEFN